MLSRFRNYINQQHLFAASDEVLLAVSGGRDSVCLASLMHKAGFRFAIAHCNFHLRQAESDRDQSFVGQLARAMDVPFHTVDFDTVAYAAENRQSIEEAARNLRYGYFADLCRRHGYACVVTAHHADDSIETFFLNLFRGTGITGLHGILPVSELIIGDEKLRIIRPLLSFSRADITRYIEENALQYVEDSTNGETDARRNQIRLQVLPLLRQLYPSFDATMLDNIRRLHSTELIYKDYIETLRAQYVTPFRSQLPADYYQLPPIDAIDLTAIKQSGNQAIKQSSLLFELMRPYGFNAATVADILTSGATGRLFYSATHVSELHRGKLLVAPLSQLSQLSPLSPFQGGVPRSGVGVQGGVPRSGIGVQGGVPRSGVGDPILQSSTRPWQPGDRFRPKGMKGTRLVSDFLKDLHLSRIEKQFVQVCVDAEGTVVAVLGLR